MNIPSIQTNNFNSQYIRSNNPYANKNNRQLKSGISYNQQAFTGNIEVPLKSKLLSPFTKGMDKFTTWLSNAYTEKLYTSKAAKFLAKKTDNLKSVVDHMQVIGSVIISGMYMIQTLRNKQMDDDRKRTLAINQGLTFALSTLGSYTIDGLLDKKWEKLTAKYAQKETGDNTIWQKLEDLNAKNLAKFEKDKAAGIIEKSEKFRPTSVLDYVTKNIKDSDLEARLKGMSVLKKLVVFGTVYRFVAPVAVTPFASWIGNKIVAKKNEKAENAIATNNIPQPTKAEENKTEKDQKATA